MTSHAGAASAPLPPRQNVVASTTAGVAQCIVTTAAKTIDIAVTAIWAPISMRRASMMSVSAPAGKVKRNIGSVVATWTADTIIGSGLRLVISQFDEVSNIANPTFDAELAISMTVNAKLPKTPQRNAQLQARPTWRWTRWTTKSPLEERESGQPMAPDSKIKWRTTADVSRRRSAKTRTAAAQKRGAPRNSRGYEAVSVPVQAPCAKGQPPKTLEFASL